MKQYDILIVEDSMTEAAILEDMLLTVARSVVHKVNGREALDYMASIDPVNIQSTIVISDIFMPVMDGYEFCRNVRQKYPDIIFVMVTGADDEQAMDESYLAGASDFITKPVLLKEMIARIKNLMSIKNAEFQVKYLLDELQKKNKMLADIAIIDGLTTLYNRKYVIEQLEIRVEEAARYKTPLSIIMMDIDNFKNMNDTYGHNAGDEVLVKVGLQIKDCLRGCDIVGRYGGEEFLVVLPNTNLENAIYTSIKINSSVKSLGFDHFPDVVITLSNGVAEYKQGISYKDFINAADVCLYRAKKNGKDRTEY